MNGTFFAWFFGIFFFTMYIFCLFTVCALTFQKGRTLLGIVGIFLPFLWLIGAICRRNRARDMPSPKTSQPSSRCSSFRSSTLAWSIGRFDAQIIHVREDALMSAPIEVFAAIFPNRAPADAVIDTLEQMNKNGAIRLVDAAIVTNSDKGKPKIDEIEELTTTKGGERGAIVGGVLGIIFPPAFLASAAVGAVAGGLWGRLRDTGFKTDELKQIAAELKPGEVAVVAVTENKWAEQLSNAMTGYDRLIRESLDANAAAVLTADPDTGEVMAAGFSKMDSGEPANPPASA